MQYIVHTINKYYDRLTFQSLEHMSQTHDPKSDNHGF